MEGIGHFIPEIKKIAFAKQGYIYLQDERFIKEILRVTPFYQKTHDGAAKTLSNS